MKCFILFVFASVALGEMEIEANESKVMVDWLISAQMANVNKILKTAKLTSIELGDHKIAAGIIAKGTKLGDLTTLQRTDHAYMWTSPGNIIQADGFIGLSNMTVSVESLEYNGQTFPATITVGVNSLGFHQNLTMQESSCQEIYSKIAFYKLNDVKIYSSIPDYNDQDISMFVQIKVLPYVNSLLQQKPFLNWVQSHFDLCSKTTRDSIHAFFHQRNKNNL